MSNTLVHDGISFLVPGLPDIQPAKPAVVSAEPNAPVGYRWVSKRWRVLPNGKRDYAAFHGKTAFSDLLPVSSRLRSPKR